LVAQKLGLPYNSPASVEAARNKFLAHQRFQAGDYRSLPSSGVQLERFPGAAAEMAIYPCVLKPLGLSASRGVIRADNPAEFVAAFRRIEALLSKPRDPRNA
jgi:biotin carboxylase